MGLIPTFKVEDSDRYTQCKLNRGPANQHAWIPEAYAVKGKILNISGQDGWVVESVWETREADCLQGRMGTVYRIQ